MRRPPQIADYCTGNVPCTGSTQGPVCQSEAGGLASLYPTLRIVVVV